MRYSCGSFRTPGKPHAPACVSDLPCLVRFICCVSGRGRDGDRTAGGLGVLFTTHDPNHALRAADRAYLLRKGERLAEGPVQQILTRERLEALYGAPVQTITDATGTAFVPG